MLYDGITEILDPSTENGYPREYIKVHDTISTSESGTHLRVMQWNVLAQGFIPLDEFVYCPSSQLTIERRCNLIALEIERFKPDVFCLQEADLLPYLMKIINSNSPVYREVFVPKHESPCLSIPGNIGPDGVAVIFRVNRVSLTHWEAVPLDEKADRNAVLCRFTLLSSDDNISKPFLVLSVHLKAKLQYSELRFKQVEHLLKFLQRFHSTLSQAVPLFICGDFNADPEERAVQLMLSNFNVSIPSWQLSSAYAVANGGSEPDFTTFKIRDGSRRQTREEACHTIDYIFFSPDLSRLLGIWSIPSREIIGPKALPSTIFPSDHVNLIADFTIP